MQWQLQEAKQRLSEVVRQAQADGPQTVTRHGEVVAVVISMADYRRLQKPVKAFNEFLTSGPATDDLDLSRPTDFGRAVHLE